MATFFNQATLTYFGNVLNSNTTEAELLSGLTLTKTAVTTSYEAGGNVVYTITVNNAGSTAYNGLTITDDLGAYTTEGGETAVPLTYVDGSVLYYLDGVLQPSPTVTSGENLEISGINIPGGSIATFIYATRTNEFAPIAAGSQITNTASTSGTSSTAPCVSSDSATITVIEEPVLTIAKAVCPAVITCNGVVTYTIIVQNLGNTPIVATDNVIISDTFNPILNDIAVALNGEELTKGTGYTYNEETGEFATTEGAITVPAATFTQDPTTGAVTTTPGTAVLTVTGTV